MQAQRARLGRRLFFIPLLVGWSAVAAAEPPEEPPVARSVEISDGFETDRTAWRREQTDATIRLEAHDRTDRAAREGRLSEHFKFGAGLGSAFYYSYRLPNVPVTDALKINLYVRGTRAGVRLFARVVLPADNDPETKRPSFLLIPGTIYSEVDRWQRLEIADLPAAVEREARALRASSRRPVNLEGAYVEQLAVNLFAGMGESEVFLDDLKVGPVPEDLAAAHAGLLADREAGQAEGAGLAVEALPGEAPPPGASAEALAVVRVDRNRLKRRIDGGLYQDWFFTGIHAPGADVGALRRAGFDVLVDDIDAPAERWREAAEWEFLLMPKARRGPDGMLPDAESFRASAAAFPFLGSVAAWHIGDGLGRAASPSERDDERSKARAMISAVRGISGASPVTTGTVADDLARYASFPRNVDLLGIRPNAWASSWEPMDTYQYLKQRRDLTVRANPGALFWASLPATPPVEVGESVWGVDEPPPWGAPKVQPEQARLFAYAALMAGYRGITFEGDADLTRDQGRMLLLEMSILNAEIDLFESILTNGVDPIPVYQAFNPDPPNLPSPSGRAGARVITQPEHTAIPGILAASIGTRDRKGVLLVVADLAGAAQFQPPQMARNDVNLTVIVPEGAQAYDVSPGRFRVLERERGVGGTRVTIKEFDSTALILVTTDTVMAERVEAVVKRIAPSAAQMAIEQAELKFAWASETNGRLAEQGHYLIIDKELDRRREAGEEVPTDQIDLLNKAAENIKAARENLERENYEDAWSEARRASRPLRVLMRGLWSNALIAMIQANLHPDDVANRDAIALGRARRVGPALLMGGVSGPGLASFNMLPQHYLWVDWMSGNRFGRNLVPSGTFDDPGALTTDGWQNASYRYEGIRSDVTTDKNSPDGRRRIVKMKVMPAEGNRIEDLPKYLDVPAAAIRSPAIKVQAGEFLKISVYVQRSVATANGGGGLIVRDSIGGEALQYVTNQPVPALSKVVIYRRAPSNGDFTVTLGLAGYGEAFFDELSVQKVESAPDAGMASAPVAAPEPVPAAASSARRASPSGRTRR